MTKKGDIWMTMLKVIILDVSPESLNLSVHCKHQKLREPTNYVGCLCMYNMGLMPRNYGRK